MPRKSNLLFLFTDEQAANTIRFMGNSIIETPNLDRLCSMSNVFQNAYVTQPVCTPSRATIMTGLYPHTHRLTENNLVLADNVLCLPEMPGVEGYRTAYYGKWHLGDETHAQHGFEDWESVDDGYHEYDTPKRDPSHRSGYYHWLRENGFEPDTKDANGYPYFSRNYCVSLPEEYSKAAYVGMMTAQYINEHVDEPFILYANFFEPHMPFSGPLDDYYNWKDIQLPANFKESPGNDFPYKASVFSKLYQHKYQNENEWKQLISRYYGLVTMVDRQVGRIIQALEENNLLDNTLIIFTSDHGDMMGSHKLAAKCVMYEEAIKVPLLIKLPNRRNHKLHKCRVSQIDLLPTILEALELPIYDKCEGQSLLPYMCGDLQINHDVFVEWNGPNNGFGDKIGTVQIPAGFEHLINKERFVASVTDPVRVIITQDGFKYSKSTIGEDVLVDLNNDPYEMNNLVKDPKYKEDIQLLSNRIKDWQARYNDF